MPSRLFSPHFLVKLRALTAADGGILVVNFYGDPDAEPAQQLARSLYKVFGNIRCASWAVSSLVVYTAMIQSEKIARACGDSIDQSIGARDWRWCTHEPCVRANASGAVTGHHRAF